MAKIIFLLLIHVLGDYILQGKKLSILKMLKINKLFLHVGIYTITLIVFSPIVLGLSVMQGIEFGLVNAVFHLLIDYGTGKLKNYYLAKSESNYLAVVAIDHTLHLILLIGSYTYMFPEAFKSVIP